MLPASYFLLALPVPQSCPQLDGSPIDCSVLDNPAPEVQSNFGNAVSILDADGDGELDIAVGAPAKKLSHIPGRVWVFFGPDFDAPVEVLSPDSAVGDQFGFDVLGANLDADAADELVIGSPASDVGGRSGAGRVYRFDWDGQQFVATGRWNAETPVAGARFGTALAAGDLLGDEGVEIAASAPRDVVPATGFTSGAVHVFPAGPLPVGPAPGARAGRAGQEHASAAGHTGAHPSAPDEPAVTSRVLYNPSSTSNLASFGHRLTVGDWNADGRHDLGVSGIFNDVEHESTTYPFAGQLVLYNSPVAPSPAAQIDNPLPWIDPIATQPTPPCAYQRFGMWIDSRDLDGDGAWELAVAAPRIDAMDGGCDVGRAFVFSPTLWTPGNPNELVFEHPTAPLDQDLMGWRVFFGDFVGDATPDLAVAALTSSKPHEILLYDGDGVAGATGLAGLPTSTLRIGTPHGPHFAEGVAVANLDGLGRDDIVTGEFDFSTPQHLFVGRVVVAYVP